MDRGHICIVGGGAAGCFAAVVCAEASPGLRVTVLERSPQLLAKVKISGGGRCNVTHACFDPRELSRFYPRGGQELLGPFHRFQPSDTIAWFERRGVRLKTESDGRIFPVTDFSQTIIDCFLRSATASGVEFRTGESVKDVQPANGSFNVTLGSGSVLQADRVLLATGGCRAASAGDLATSLGHSLQDPVPSLFTFQLAPGWIQSLAGVSLEAAVKIPGTKLSERGPVLMTHCGFSGPAVLRLSAWGARVLHGLNYRFPLQVNWLPHLKDFAAAFRQQRAAHPARLLVNAPLANLPARFWESLVLSAGVPRDSRWAQLSRAEEQQLVRALQASEFQVMGKSLNKDEFVTCGGVSLREVEFRTMQSRICPGLHFAGELLDIDGLTGGFNFQAAWTTGWLAGNAMAGVQV